MIKRFTVLLFAIFIIILNIGCSRTNIKGETHKSFHNSRTESSVYKIQVDKNIKYIKIDLDAEINTGEFKIAINDPTGKKYWSKGTDQDTRGLDIDFKIENPKKGDWEIIIELDGAIGEYRCSWEAR